MLDLTTFQQALLLDVSMREKLVGDSPHGLAIKDDVSEMYRSADLIDADDAINHGRLYPNLNELVEKGYLEKGKQDDRTNWYGLTEAGADAINRYAHLLMVAQGKDAANPYVPPGHDVDGQPAETVAEAADD